MSHKYFQIWQESLPGWTQEAYWPKRIKYSTCCPIPGGGGRGYLPWWAGRYLGVPLPPPDLARGRGTCLGGVGTLGYPHPHPGLARGGEYLPWPGVGTPHLDLTGIPLPSPGVTENITFPHPSDGVHKNKNLKCSYCWKHLGATAENRHWNWAPSMNNTCSVYNL